jgi:hypothetical protein
MHEPPARVRALLRRSTAAAGLLLLTIATVIAARPAEACDICAIYSATDVAEEKTGVRLGFAEQYTHFTSEQLNGKDQPNPYGEHLYSSNTQLFGGYQFNKWIGVQLNVPILYRSWRRVLEDGDIQESTRASIGDIALVANLLAYDALWDNSIFRFTLLGGLKLPTGNADFLAEELEEEDPGDEEPASVKHGGEHHGTYQSGVHGHDLAFGSGSVDGIVGYTLYWSYYRFFMTAAMQYKATTEGSFDYQFANDLTWLGGPNYYLLLDHDYALSMGASLSGETKGLDTQKGQRLDDTGITALYVGPAIDFAWESALSAEIAADLPVVQNNTAYQIVPDFRLRAALVWRF